MAALCVVPSCGQLAEAARHSFCDAHWQDVPPCMRNGLDEARAAFDLAPCGRFGGAQGLWEAYQRLRLLTVQDLTAITADAGALP